jgi:TetR/AcrR family transcriptional regulator, ethionamide resistance regulator
MSVAVQRSKRRREREEVRERILEAAAQLLRDRPYRELTVEEVMVSAGFSRTIFYRHFDDLPDLVLRLLEAPSADLLERERQIALVDLPLDEAVRQALEAPVQAFAKHGPLLRAIAEATSHDETIERGFTALMKQYDELILGYLRLLSDLGRGRLSDHAAAARALNLMNVHFLLDVFGRPEPRLTPEAALQTLTEIWVGAVLGDPSTD